MSSEPEPSRRIVSLRQLAFSQQLFVAPPLLLSRLLDPEQHSSSSHQNQFQARGAYHDSFLQIAEERTRRLKSLLFEGPPLALVQQVMLARLSRMAVELAEEPLLELLWQIR